ncbi:hypothetical protein [Paraglaciecola sp.]|uniref:hypothetical protein n=1 Tax=Paraglaciecola sp. TaxID=1920173 RepID=UPI003265A363
MSQLRKWCLHTDYCVEVEPDKVRQTFRQIQIPLHSICFTDDKMLSVTNMHDLHELFVHKNRMPPKLTPTDMGVERVGHLGFSKAQFEDSLWSDL